MNKTFVVTVIALVLVACNRDLRDPRDRFFTIGIKESIHSDVLKEDRPFFVYVPPYARNSGKKFPVLYLLDGEAHFHSISGLIQILGTGVNGTRVVPEMIVVAIPNTDRTRDLTPSHSEMMEGKKEDFLKSSGGGYDFLKFMQTELIPYIDKSYPSNFRRMLVGHSFGGITAINALYTMPETFDSYIAIDPSLWWDTQLLVKRANRIFSIENMQEKCLYIAQANTLEPGTTTNEHFEAIKDFVKILESPANTSGIRWDYKYYPDDSHGSVPLIAEYDGLRFAFKSIQFGN